MMVMMMGMMMERRNKDMMGILKIMLRTIITFPVSPPMVRPLSQRPDDKVKVERMVKLKEEQL